MTRFVYLAIGLIMLMFVATAHANQAKAPSLCTITHPSDKNVKWECHRLRKGETLEKLFGDKWLDVLRFNRIDRRHIYQGIYLKIPNRLDLIKNFTPMPEIYQPAEKEAKFILVDLSEQFLGAYEFGRLVFSVPIATGEGGNCTPGGDFTINAFDPRHHSSLYFVEKTVKKYPMNYALRFFTNSKGVDFWIHGRDLPGYPASHGCIGLYDEEMQKKYYKYPRRPLLEDAKTLYQWVVTPSKDYNGYTILENGPKIRIIGHAPLEGPECDL
jgi:hypothetical protein